MTDLFGSGVSGLVGTKGICPDGRCEGSELVVACDLGSVLAVEVGEGAEDVSKVAFVCTCTEKVGNVMMILIMVVTRCLR